LPIRLREGWRSGWIAAMIACRANCSRSARSAICAGSIRQPVVRAALRDFRDRDQHLGLVGIADGVCVWHPAPQVRTLRWDEPRQDLGAGITVIGLLEACPARSRRAAERERA
jgi:hypothetical protein